MSDWPRVRLGDLAEINPRRPKLVRPDDADSTFVPMPAVDGDLGTIAEPMIKPFGTVKKGYTYFEAGDLIFAKITPCLQNGKHAIARDLIDDIGFGSTEFHVVRPGPRVTVEWLWLCLRRASVLTELARHMEGAVGQQRLPEERLAEVEIPVPPLEVQGQLGATTAATLDRIREGRALASATEEKLIGLRRAVLDEAFGPLDYPVVDLGSVAEVKSGLTKGRNVKGATRPYPYLRAANLGDARLDLAEIKEIEASEAEAQRSRLEVGDVLLVEGSGSAGRLGQGWLWEGQIADCLHQNHVFRARPSARLDSRYLAWYLQTSAARDYFLGVAKTTSGLHTINRGEVVALTLPLPPREVQAAVVASIESRLGALKALAAGVQGIVSRFERIREAFLDDVFEEAA